MQGPRTKDAVELEWSAIKRALTAKINYEAQVWRERRLNDVLAEAWQEFSTSLANGELVYATPPELS